MIAKPRDHRDPWRFIALARAKHSAKRPSRKTEKIVIASDALAAQGLSGWLARMQGEYYSRGKVMLESIKRIGADHEADWQAALAAFHAMRRRATH